MECLDCTLIFTHPETWMAEKHITMYDGDDVVIPNLGTPVKVTVGDIAGTKTVFVPFNTGCLVLLMRGYSNIGEALSGMWMCSNICDTPIHVYGGNRGVTVTRNGQGINISISNDGTTRRYMVFSF